jgi:hypothetical protein
MSSISETKPLSKPKSDFVSFVRKYLVFEGLPCSRHCNKPTHFVTLMEDRNKLVGAYVCQDNYVVRMVCFELSNQDIGWFKSFVRGELDGGSLVRDRDFRFATRHGWELGGESENEIQSFSNSSSGLKEYYWTFYPRGDEEKKQGNFLCERCGKLFTQPIDSKNKICQRH